MSGTHVEFGMILDERDRLRFTVEVIHRVQGAVRLWSGGSYETAILQAEQARAEFGPVEDRVLDDIQVWMARAI